MSLLKSDSKGYSHMHHRRETWNWMGSFATFENRPYATQLPLYFWNSGNQHRIATGEVSKCAEEIAVFRN